jgi:transcription initiation factor TFIIIB Brf1 subunit/transcription initiation factor TFIIB
MWMTNYCPECGGEMTYDLNMKLYTCKSCGITLSYQELLEAKNKNIHFFDDEKKRERKEYLKWWLSKKES